MSHGKEWESRGQEKDPMKAKFPINRSPFLIRLPHQVFLQLKQEEPLENDKAGTRVSHEAVTALKPVMKIKLLS